MLQSGTDRADVLILGAGASGLMCAAACAARGLSVTVVDWSREPGRKLAIAGGGKANFTNSGLAADKYRCSTNDFVPPALEAFGVEKLLRFMDSLRLPYERRAGGRYFLTTTARDLVAALLSRCRAGACRLAMNARFDAEDIRLSQRGVSLVTRQRRRHEAAHLVVALGSPACPAVGASGLGFAVAERLGHSIVPPEAALTPLYLEKGSPLRGLAGMSLPATVSTESVSFTDDILFTGDGLSGPAALKASLFWRRGEPLTLDFLPGEDAGKLFSDANAGRGTARSLLARRLPRRLVDRLLPEAIGSRRCVELPRAVREKIARRFSAFVLVPAGAAGLRKAEVCRGGVDTREIFPGTFASRREPRCSFVGEVLDVTGLLGGYNLHWAFASGWLAARAVSSM